MIVELTTEELQYFFETELDEIKGKQDFSKEIIKQFKIKVRILMSISTIKDLLQFKSLNFEKLKGKLSEFYSIRLNKQYRLIFKVSETENEETIIEIIQVTEISKHYE
jgi:proteic killer suppression protein